MRENIALDSFAISAIGGFFATTIGAIFMQSFEGWEGPWIALSVLGAWFYLLPWAALIGAGGWLVNAIYQHFDLTNSTLLTAAVAAALVYIASNGAAYAAGIESGAPWACAILALITLYACLRLLPDLLGSRHAVLAATPGLVLSLVVFGITANDFALWESIHNSFMDPNAVLIAALAGVGLVAGLSSALIYLQTESKAVYMLAAAIMACALTLSYLNRFVLVPRLYLEAHTTLAIFEWVLYSAAIAPALRRLNRPSPGVITFVGFVVGLAALLVNDGRTSRRVDHTAEAFADPWSAFVDWDDDGHFAEWFGGVDCDDRDERIHPFARDLPNDGVDQNCLGGDYEPAHSPTRATVLERESADLVLLISIDMLRPDMMSVYGHDQPTTPFLKSNAADWIRFENAYASGGITTLSLPSLTRGLIPLALNFEPVYRTTEYTYLFEDQLGDVTVNRVFPSVRGDHHTTVAERFVHSAAFVDDGPSGVFQKGLGYERGFGFFRYPNEPDGPGYPAWGHEQLTNALLTYLPNAEPGTFVWAHYYDPHNASGPCRRFELIPGVACYLDAIHDIDQEIERIVEALKDAGRYEKSTIIITSDHGEALGEHRLAHHGTDGYEEFIKIPTLVKPARGLMAGTIVQTPVSLVDAATTALASGGVHASGEIRGTHGKDLLKIARENERPPVLSQGLLLTLDGRAYRQTNVLVRENERIMYDRVTRRTWAFDLTNDTLQRRRLDPTPEQLETLFDMIDALESAPEPAPRGRLP